MPNRDLEWPDYVNVWQRALPELLGWEQRKTEAWIKWAEERFKHNSLLTHELAIWYIAPLLIPKTLKIPGRLKAETLVQLVSRIEHAIEQGDDAVFRAILERDRHSSPGEWKKAVCDYERKKIEEGAFLSDFAPELFDWKAARKRAEAILAEYGARLPRDELGDP